MSRSNKPVFPGAKRALDQLKEETAAEIGLTNYRDMYKGALTSADNGRVGGNMVRKMIQSQQNQMVGGSQQQGKNQGNGQQQTLTSQYDINQ